MKKSMLIFLLLLIFTVFASGSRESWISGGGEFGHSMETQYVEGTQIKTTMNSIGAYLKVLQFNNGKDVGIIVHDSFLLPLGGQLTIDGESFDYSLSDAEFRSLLGIMTGPVLKKHLSEGKDFYIGGGLSIQQLGFVYSPSNTGISYLFGIGLNTGLKIDIGQRTYWDVGLMADATFYSYSTTSAHPEGYSSSLLNISIRPHIGMGYVFKMHYGEK